MPFVLGLQCCLFYLPRLVWQAICYNETGINLESMINKAMEAVHANDKSRSDIVESITSSLEQLIFQVEIINSIVLVKKQYRIAVSG